MLGISLADRVILMAATTETSGGFQMSISISNPQYTVDPGYTVTVADRAMMNALIDTLSYPSAVKVNLVDAVKVESFIENYPEVERQHRGQAVLALHEALSTHGAFSKEFDAAYVRWERINGDR